MKKKIISAIFMLCAIVCLGFGLTACDGSEESDPIKYAQSVLSNYGENYDYVYTYDEQNLQEAQGYIGGWHTYYCYVSTTANKITITKLTEVESDDSKNARTIIGYFELVPDGENVNVSYYDVHNLTYTTDVLTQSEYEEEYPFLIENIVNAFVNFDVDNPIPGSQEQYYKNEELRTYQKKVDDSFITLENTCSYYVGGIPSGDERGKETDDGIQTDLCGVEIRIERKTGHIVSVINQNINGREVEYSYNKGKKSVDTKYFGTTKLEALGKILSDMTQEQPNGNYKMDGSIVLGSGTPQNVTIVYDAEKDMTKTISESGVVYQKFEFNEDATETETFLTLKNYTENNHSVDVRTYTREEYLTTTDSNLALSEAFKGIKVVLQDYDEAGVEIVHDEDEHTTLITLTSGDNTITINFKNANDYTIKSETENLSYTFDYKNHKISSAELIIDATSMGGVREIVTLTYTYENVSGFDFDESLYTGNAG